MRESASADDQRNAQRPPPASPDRPAVPQIGIVAIPLARLHPPTCLIGRMHDETFMPMKLLRRVPGPILHTAAGLLIAVAIIQAEEQQVPVLTSVTTTTLSGFVDTSAIWSPAGGSLQPVTDFPSAALPPVPADVIGVRVQQMGDPGMLDLPPGPAITDPPSVFNSAPAVPEPSTVALSVLGAIGAAFCFRARSTAR